MTKFVTFVSEIRLHALLCSSAAVLLTACGGGVDSGSASATSGQPLQTAALSFNSDAAAATTAPATLEQTSPAEASAAPQDSASEVYTGNFELLGYSTDTTATVGTPQAALTTETAAASASEPALATDGAALPAGAIDPAAVIPATTYNYYVSPSGSDTNPGSKAAPFKTLARAAKATRASTTVWVAPGTYAGGLKTTISGTASGRIYFVSTTKWGARVVPPSSSSNSTAWDNRGNYIDIIGFDVDGTVSQSGTKWLHGIYNGGSYGTIRENHIHHIAKSVTCTSAGGSAIGVDSYYHGVKTDVIGNMVNDIGPTGCRYIQGIYISTSGSVKNNVVYRVAEAAIHLWHDATNVIITNNTVTTSHTGIVVGGGDFYYTAGPDDYTAVYNNIVYDNYYGISEQGKTGVHNTYRNNLVYQNTVNWTLRNGLTHYNTVSSAPYFVGYTKTGTPNLHLTSSSPAIGRGTATNAYPTDFDGRPRNSSTGYDIGAYQH
jgi:hypothetical protein